MTFAPGDRVHLAGLGTGTIRESRGAGRYAIDIKGRIIIAAAGDLEPADSPPKRSPAAGRHHRPHAQISEPSRTRPHPAAPAAPGAPGRTQPHRTAPGRTEPHPVAPGRTQPHPVAPGRTQPLAVIDLHGKTVDEALVAVEVWMNDVLLAGHGDARVIHGRSGGRLKSAVHQYLRGLQAVASFRIDPQNPGVTIVTFS
jgi:DNA-nicking Smr family endonuclease